jgi:endonuclease YncB( thermonuclease family)
MKKLSLLFILTFLFSLTAGADTIILKNGKRITATSVWEEDDLVKCLRFGAVIGYLKENVQRVEISPIKEQVKKPPIPPHVEDSVPFQESPLSDNEKNDSAGHFRVRKIYDGDSFEAAGHEITIKVRLVGIDAPETEKTKKGKDIPGQPYSKEAKNYLEALILNQRIRIKGYGTDQYNRQLAEVFAKGRNINIELLKAGLAEVYQGRPPKSLDITPYQEAETQAKNMGKGMWRMGYSYVSPKEWRRMY